MTIGPHSARTWTFAAIAAVALCAAGTIAPGRAPATVPGAPSASGLAARPAVGSLDGGCDNRLEGGAGNTTLVLTQPGGADTILDFGVGDNLIRIVGYSRVDGFGDLAVSAGSAAPR